MTTRRLLLLAGAALPLAGFAQAAEVERLLRAGGVVLAMRHAHAPGTYDPPQFRLGDCSTQRNLDERGRQQSRAIGAWFAARALKPARVRSSPWCRCLDTARLAFGAAEPWAALGSPRASDGAARAAHLRELRSSVGQAAAPGRFEVWVTHQFLLSDLVGGGTASGEGLVLQGDGTNVRLLARLEVAT